MARGGAATKKASNAQAPAAAAAEEPTSPITVEATHAQLLRAWWVTLPLTWFFYWRVLWETALAPLFAILKSLEVLPPLCTTYPGSDLAYGPCGFIYLNAKGQPVPWYMLYLVHHPLSFLLSSMTMAQLRVYTTPLYYTVILPALMQHPKGQAALQLLGLGSNLLALWVVPHFQGAWLRRFLLYWKVVAHAPYQKEGQSRAWRVAGRVAVVHAFAAVLALFLVALVLRYGGVTVYVYDQYGNVVVRSLWERILDYESYPEGSGGQEAYHYYGMPGSGGAQPRTVHVVNQQDNDTAGVDEYPDFEL